MSAQDDIKWDGKIYPYVPSDPLQIDPGISLHSTVAEDIDPISFEVIRYAMWNINVEQGNTLLRISGSPIAAYGHDFNPCLLDESGDFVFFGPFLQYLSSASGSAVKWTLEYRSSNPGISDGDIFLTNDPWVGAIHQADVCIFAPLFWEGELFCWFANTLHQWDLGGTTPGAFNPISQDVFWEAGCIPPIKIVEQGVLRKDLEEEYIRRSRMPDLVALDLRAQITACNVARERMQQLIEKYGPGVVKGVMKKLQDNSEIAFVKRLETIPDGTWAEESWVELSREGDRSVYRNVVRLTKKGDRLIFDNEGTAPQIGSINCAAIAWKGAIASMISAQMLFDQMFVIEGAYRHMEFRPTPGTLTCAKFPAGVVSAPPTVLLQTIGLAGLVISRMLYCSTDEVLQKEVQSCMGTLCFPIDAIAGIDQRGAGYASFLLDPVGGALGALSWKDGVNTGGWPWDLQSTMPNVEDNEIFYPLLYLWRKEIPNSGGSGKFRGGNAAEIAYVVNDSDAITHYTTGGHTIIPGPSLFGGDPTSRTRYLLIRNAGVREAAAQNGKMPAGLEELGGKHTNVSPKTGGVVQESGDIFSLAWTSAAGFGDPLERDPRLVVQDIDQAYISPDWARQRNGVCLDENGALDIEETDALRMRMRQARLSSASGPGPAHHTMAEKPGDIRVSEGLVIAKSGEGAFYTCTKCRTQIQNTNENYKSGCIKRVTDVSEVGLSPIDPKLFIDDIIEYREYFCPGCGLLLQGDFNRPDDPDFRDICLASAAASGPASQADD
jgi:N-methylhydantoinase B